MLRPLTAFQRLAVQALWSAEKALCEHNRHVRPLDEDIDLLLSGAHQKSASLLIAKCLQLAAPYDRVLHQAKDLCRESGLNKEQIERFSDVTFWL
jgi:hypothetical protein